ncbi:MAG: hypothetical protein WC236_01875 [Gallionellaceae bacterium]|jgi:hypothetical protein
MKLSNEEYYIRSVIELADILPVTTCQGVFSTTGIKLVNKGVLLNSTFLESWVDTILCSRWNRVWWKTVSTILKLSRVRNSCWLAIRHSRAWQANN